MGIFSNIWKMNNEGKTYKLTDSALVNVLGISDVSSKFSEVTYFTCVQHLAKTMSKMPKHIYQRTAKRGKERKASYLDYILNIEPNPYYTASTLWGVVELNRVHYGNAYVYKEYVRGKIKHLWLLPSDTIQIYLDTAGIFGTTNNLWYVWTDPKTSKRYIFSNREILHYKTHMSMDGITGLATKDILKTQINSLHYSQQYQGKLFKNNMFGGKVIMHHTDQMKSDAKDALITETERYANSIGSGKFLPIPSGIEIKLLDIKLSDAEFVNLNKLSALQLAGAFGIPPTVIGQYDKATYNNSELQQLAFLTNCLQPIFKGYNDEDTVKLLEESKRRKQGMFCEIEKEALFELDKKTKTEVLVKQLNNFAVTPNEMREQLGYSHKEDDNANKLYGNGNLIELSKAGQGKNYRE